MQSPQNNKKSLFDFIEESTAFIQEKIIEIIETDEYWLEELGIIDIEEQNSNTIKDIIRTKLVDIENYENTNKVIAYVLDDYVLGVDDKFSIFHGVCSIDSYSRDSALYVFKFNSKFFCYYLPERSLITIDPISFIKEAIKDEMIQFDIEKENMVDENFKDTEFTLDLNWNISPDFEY
jgi:hypothetical protein